MKQIGIYIATNGDTFDLVYFTENKNAIAIGPLPKPQPWGNGIGNPGEYANVSPVSSQEEAKEKLTKAIEEKIAKEKK